MPALWLVAGLGNPGARYAGTRHNLGAMAVECLADRFGVRLSKVRFLAAHAAQARRGHMAVLLVRPATFMNQSGPPIAALARKRGIPVERMIACHDDIDLPLGRLRVRRGGSTAGHRGLESMVGAIGSADFYRIRMGVGRPPGRKDPADYVLEPFTKQEHEEARAMVAEAADAVLSLADLGLEVTQDRYNRRRVQ